MCCSPNQKIGEHPLSRSYGVIFSSSFDMVLSSVLVYSTCSPVSVWDKKLKAFITMTTVVTINRLATMTGRYALLSHDPCSKTKGPS
ncbi:hypothetical protein AMTRI_Chr08g164290 [Amborella trichopoda]